MGEIDYKTAFVKLKDKYPQIAEEVIPVNPIMDNLKMLSVFTTFCCVKGITFLQVGKDKNNYVRDLFVAVFVRVFDPDYLKGYKTKLRKGLRSKMASLVGCRERVISYNLRNVKDYMRIYKDFREEVEYIYQAVKLEIDEKP